MDIDDVEAARRALKRGSEEGLRVVLDNYYAQAAGSPAAAKERAADASAANSAGRFVMKILDAEGRRRVESSASRQQARELIRLGATFVGSASRAP